MSPRIPWRGVAAPLLISRALLLAVVLLTAALVLGTTPPFAALPRVLVQWDAHSYLRIADHGYPASVDPLDAFLPGFPLMVRAVAFAVSDTVWAALTVCLAAQAFALAFVWRLVRRERDAPAARFCVLLLAVAPAAVFFTAPYTEGPFIAATAASLWCARERRFAGACAAAAVATSTRLTGLALLPAIVLELVRARRPARDYAWLLLVPVPLLLYAGYMALHTGHWDALFQAEASPSFGLQLTPPWSGFAATWNTMVTAPDGETRSIFAREIAFGLLGLVACVSTWVSPRIPRAFALYCTVAWVMTASLSFWRSEARYLLALFPALLVVADVTQRVRPLRGVLVGASAALMCAGTVIFVEGRWLG